MRRHVASKRLVAGLVLFASARSSALELPLRPVDAGPPRIAILDVPSDAPALGVRPAASLLFGNCGSTTALLGADHRSAIDLASVNWSSRLVVQRVTFGGGWVQPFAQIGFGEWRKDADRRWDGDLWYGFQYAAGVQIRAPGRVALAFEVDQAHVRQGSFELLGDFRSMRAAFIGARVPLP